MHMTRSSRLRFAAVAFPLSLACFAGPTFANDARTHAGSPTRLEGGPAESSQSSQSDSGLDLQVGAAATALLKAHGTGQGGRVYPNPEITFGVRKQGLGFPKLVVGGDLSGGAAWSNAGTPAVSYLTYLGGFSGRGLIGYELLDSNRFSIVPFMTAGAIVYCGVLTRNITGEGDLKFRPLIGTNAGVGFELGLWWLRASFDLTPAVYSDLKLGLSSRTSLTFRW